MWQFVVFSVRATHIQSINLLHRLHLFYWVDLLLADEVSDGHH